MITRTEKYKAQAESNKAYMRAFDDYINGLEEENEMLKKDVACLKQSLDTAIEQLEIAKMNMQELKEENEQLHHSLEIEIEILKRRCL